MSELVARFDVPYDCSVELSPLGIKFLTETFQAFDKVITSIHGFLAVLMDGLRIATVTSIRRSWKSSSAHHRGTHGRIINSQTQR